MKQLDDIANLLKMTKGKSDTLIYRGQNKSWPLLPKIARNSVEKLGYEDWLTLEDDLLNRFINDVTLILEKEPKNKIEWLILGQHYGLPTRLLD